MTPKHLPALPEGYPLPEGYHYLGVGGSFKVNRASFKGLFLDPRSGKWLKGDWLEGSTKFWHYATKDPEMIKLNQSPLEEQIEIAKSFVGKTITNVNYSSWKRGVVSDVAVFVTQYGLDTFLKERGQLCRDVDVGRGQVYVVGKWSDGAMMTLCITKGVSDSSYPRVIDSLVIGGYKAEDKVHYYQFGAMKIPKGVLRAVRELLLPKYWGFNDFSYPKSVVIGNLTFSIEDIDKLTL